MAVLRRFEEKTKEFLTTEDTEDTEVRKKSIYIFLLTNTTRRHASPAAEIRIA
jgi:hypothetical protein